MWFATQQGLNRYDGYQMIYYKNDPINPRNNILTSVCADSSGVIWIGTWRTGLDRFDPFDRIFKHFRHDTKDDASLSNDTITAILQDHQGTLWIGTHDGLNRFDSRTGHFIHYRHDTNDSASLSNNQVRAIYEDRQGTLWIGTGSCPPCDTRNFSPYPLDGGGSEEGGLNRFDKKTGKFIRYLHDRNDQHSLINDNVSAIFEDSKGNFWVGTAGDGLHTMDRTKGTFERHLYHPSHPEGLSRPPLNKQVIWDYITFIIEDAAGGIWIGTSDAGLNYYDTKTKKITHYGSGKDTDGRFPDKNIRSAFTSREGVLWIGTMNRNLYRIDPFQRNIPHYASPGSSVVESFIEEAGTLWIGTEEGLFRKNLTTGAVKRFIYDPLDPASLSSNYIQYILKDREGKIWIGATGGGLDLLNKDNETFTHYRHALQDSSSLSHNGVHFIYEDPEAKLWIATEMGLNLMDRKTGKFRSYFIDPNDTVPGGANFITYVLKDRQRKFWVGTWFGLYMFNQQNGRFKEYWKGKSTYSLCEDSQGNLWVGSNDGLYLYNRTSDTFSPFVDPSSLTSIPDVISIAEDNQKNLWICGSNGLLKLNPERNKTSLYGANYGVRGEDFELTYCYKSPHGRLYFSDQTGYFAFFPDQLSKNDKPPEIVFTAFRLADQVVKPEKEGPLAEPLLNAKEIHLHHDQNVFSIDFAAFNYSNPQSNRHLFKLENYENQWRPSGSERRAYYFNVPPGNYVFRVKAASSNGVWAEKSIKIIITPPWWRSWWFYALCFISAFALIYILFRYRLNQKLKAYELRNTISRDLHDEVGSTLSSIGFLSSMALEDVNNNQEKAHTTLASINESANKMLDAMNDIIWNIQPQNDTLENIIVRMISFASELLEAKKISLNLNVEDNIKQLRLGLKVRHDFLIIYKEAINNLAKYSAATTANICLKYQQPYLVLTISDNGKGFDPNTIRNNGNGLKNMKTRAQKIGAVYHLHSEPGTGTTITLQVKPSL